MNDLPEPVLREGVYYPDPESNIGKVEDGYTADQMREYRNAALEEAAKVCEGRIGGAVQSNDWWNGFKSATKQCGAAIRALKEATK